jgi:hypothetical protein
MSWRFSIILIVVVLAMQQQASAAGRTVSLITSMDCAQESISPLDVRKIYLGVRVSFEGKPVRAFRLGGDRNLNQIFYQSVVALSEKTYERRLLRLLLKYGQPRPLEFDSVEKLIAAVVTTRCSIAYVWHRDIEERDDVKVIRVLWQED